MYKFIVRPFFFLYSPEKAHYTTMDLLHTICYIPGVKWLLKKIWAPKNPKSISLMGLNFPNKVGLAAGFDKDGRYLELMDLMGFGFIEVGTVTPLPQLGNPLPRLFRLPKDQALINRMGFNNRGVDPLVKRIDLFKKKYPENPLIIGANIGKNKNTTNEKATQDYRISFEKLFPVADYFVVNVSSPNTPGLRTLQEKEPLNDLLSNLQYLNDQKVNPKPILLKIAPDLTVEQCDDIIEIVLNTKISGIVATNTTITRDNLLTDTKDLESIGLGGLSGKPVKDASTKIIQYFRQKLGKDFVIIGVGGISSSEDAQEKINAGADLVQIYTGLIYEGPALPGILASKI
jgi:dihydroorotate dehydrogenase